MNGILTLTDVQRKYGQKYAVENAHLTLEAGRITCLLGPSGCGKSTLLRLIAGLEPVDAGRIEGRSGLLSGPGTHVPPEQRDMGFVFQDYALFPHLTVEQNVGFGLKRLRPEERHARIMAELEEVRLSHRASSYPQSLSGGEQQRVALARALARKPSLVLLDEPFSGLDGRLKADVRDTTLRALRDAGAAALIVTHDAEEAMMMADELALMEAGQILQTGSPRNCYLEPVNVAAARLLGEVNLIPALVAGGKARTAFGEVPAYVETETLMVRPEGVLISPTGQPATVTGVAFAGATMMLTLTVDHTSVQCRVSSSSAPEVGETVTVGLDPTFCMPVLSP
jgi:iron(III) transport system ATP-binding protein